MGDASYHFWRKVLVVVIVVGYVASISYVRYPYSVEVKGTFIASDGSRAELVDFECSSMIYSVCPDPGQQPVADCIAPPVMNMTNCCTEVHTGANPGHY